MIVTATQLLAIMPSARKRYSEYLKYINKYAKEFNINTPLSPFLNTILASSKQFNNNSFTTKSI